MAPCKCPHIGGAIKLSFYGNVSGESFAENYSQYCVVSEGFTPGRLNDQQLGLLAFIVRAAEKRASQQLIKHGRTFTFLWDWMADRFIAS